ncbi:MULTISPECIES: hypothetical protein [unclassified Microcoleus]|uniref:hypothetical protein n=1 Tax=unclassified Microcoleus TaxID=2642155 RepID=UPI0025EF735A|nr:MULTISPECIES: hypothetical protein [unclassified Microcoleus]
MRFLAQVGDLGDRAQAVVVGVDPHWLGVKGSTFLDGFPIFSRWGSFGKRAVDGLGCSGFSDRAPAKADLKNQAAGRSYK